MDYFFFILKVKPCKSQWTWSKEIVLVLQDMTNLNKQTKKKLIRE